MGEKFKLRPPSEGGDWVPIPDQSTVAAKLTGAKSTTIKFRDKEQDKIEWNFTVTEQGEFQGRDVRGLTGTKFVGHPDCKFYQWTKVLLGGNDLPEGFEVDLEDLLGLEVLIQVSMKESPKQDGDGTWKNNSVVDVRPIRETASVGSARPNVVDEEPF